MADITRKTANLAHNNREKGYTLSSSTGLPVPSTSTNTKGWCFMTPIAQVKVGDKIHVHIDNPDNIGFWCGWSIVSDNVKKDSASGRGNNSTITATYDGDFYFVCYVLKADESKLDEMINTLMLNFGTTTLPYEPCWVHSLRKQCSATETIQSGDTIYANGSPISTYTIKGNTVQSGTPTPSNPVAVNGVGERTENLYNYAETVWTSGVKDDNGNTTGSTTSHFTSNFTAVKSSTKYSITGVYASGSSTAARIYYYDSSKVWISRTAAMRDNPLVFETPVNCKYIQIQCANGADGTDFNLVEGEYTSQTMPPLEPYGFKIPILNVQTTPIYLSQPLYKIDNYTDDVNSSGTATYKITMQRITQISQSNNFSRGFTVDIPVPADIQTIYSNIAVGTSSLPVAADRDGKVFINTGKTYIGFGASEDFPISGSGNPTPAEMDVFKAYLQNNEVYVWYVLATPTTETVTAPSIPTTDGANSISIDTTVQPSEFSATWTGWHNASVKEKSVNLFDINTVIEGMFIRAGNATESSPLGSEVANNSWSCTDYIEVEPNTTYTVHYPYYQTATAAGLVFFSSKDVSDAISGVTTGVQSSDTYTFTTPNNCAYVRLSWDKRNGNETMLNTGETALPYEPCWK